MELFLVIFYCAFLLLVGAGGEKGSWRGNRVVDAGVQPPLVTYMLK